MQSDTLTPFQADTLFGHLCWVVAHNKEDEDLQKFLKPFKEGEPPFIISDGFPAELLPKPLSSEFSIVDPSERKELKKIEYIALEDFNGVRNGEKRRPRFLEKFMKSFLTSHNTINRLTNAALAEGGVYSLEETFVLQITLYVKVISEEWKNRIGELFKELSKSGYGRKKSIGKGHFSVDTVEPYNGFTEIEDANGFVTLSNFCPAENDPIEGLYKTFIKYGKLGEEFTFCGNPFKKPLFMIKTGSVFRTNGPPKEFYGGMVNNISPAKPEVVQYAYAFAVPIRYPDVLIKHYERETS
jgi:CRISPR-associated protein Csm4